jgi:hypothetical protein
MHLNNGRYWTLMDHGRADLMIRFGLWRTVGKNQWLPVVSAGKIRFRRELRLFQPFTLKTRIVAWTEGGALSDTTGSSDVIQLRECCRDRKCPHYCAGSVPSQKFQSN